MSDYCEHQWKDEAEIERLQQENEKLRAMLKEARDEIYYQIQNDYPPESLVYPSQARRYAREMDFIYDIDRVLK